MKNLLINVIAIVIIIGLTVFIQHKFFPNEIENTIHKTDTIYKDSIRVEYHRDTVFQPYYVEVVETDTVEIPADTAELARRYLAMYSKFFSTYFYKDTIKNDSIAFIGLGSEISQNKPVKYTLDFIDRTPLIINSTTNIYAQNEFYIGMNMAAPTLLFKHKGGWIIGGGYDLLYDEIRFQGYISINKIIGK